MFVQKAADLVTFCAFRWLLRLLTGDLHAALRYAGAGSCNVAGRRRSRAGSNMAKNDMSPRGQARSLHPILASKIGFVKFVGINPLPILYLTSDYITFDF